MKDSIEYKGKWKVVSQKKWLDGVLKTTSEGTFVLELFGSFDLNFISRETKDIIWGKTVDGHHITLVDCRYGALQYSNNTKVIFSSCFPTYVLVGKHFRTKLEIGFRKVTFKTFNLFNWLNTSGIKTDFGKGVYSISYAQPEEINFDLSNKCKGNITFISPYSSAFSEHQIKIEEDCQVCLSYKKKIPFQDIIRDINIFNGFVTLNSLEQSYSFDISFDGSLPNVPPERIQCWYNNSFYSSKYKNRTAGEFLISYSDIKQDFSLIISTWYSKYIEIMPVFNLLLYSFKERLMFKEEKFMDIVRGLETFHRRTEKNVRMQEEDYKNLISEVDKTSLSNELKKILSARLKYGNEPFLRERLTELIAKYSPPDFKKETGKGFIMAVVVSRNYYTHYDPSLEKDALKGNKLYHAYYNLLALLTSCILKYIGIDKHIIDEAIKDKYIVNSDWNS